MPMLLVDAVHVIEMIGGALMWMSAIAFILLRRRGRDSPKFSRQTFICSDAATQSRCKNGEEARLKSPGDVKSPKR